ncbi:permease [Bacillus halotolerans]|uniref:permease n=1 Tax=Bacillus halotolerans TaxID=260554 RepID=UPI002D7F1E59|nr:permease [Bacillus halotolerans]
MKSYQNISCIIQFYGDLLSIIGQIFGILTDFFIPGIARFIGVIAGILVLLSLKSRNTEMQAFILGSSTALGIMGAGILYVPAAMINVFISFKLNKKLKEENVKEQI